MVVFIIIMRGEFLGFTAICSFVLSLLWWQWLYVAAGCITDVSGIPLIMG